MQTLIYLLIICSEKCIFTWAEIIKQWLLCHTTWTSGGMYGTHVFAAMFIPNFIKYDSVCAKRFWMSLQLLARSIRSSAKADVNVLGH
jgi:hypothetical protein